MKRKNKDKNELMLSRSNELIQARYKSSLLGNQILVLALKRAKKDDMGRPSVSISSKELLQLTKIKNHNIYRQLKEIAQDLIDITFYLDNPEEQKFKYFNLIHNAEYESGKFTINFTPECNDLLYNLQSNYTTISLELLFSFNSNYAFRLYELLKVHAYKIDAGNNPYEIEFRLSDLKLQMGCIDADEKDVKRALRSDRVDVDDIVENIAVKKKYNTWYDFRRNVLEKAIKEINEKTDLKVGYEPVRSGRGAKVRYVKFYLQKLDEENNEELNEATMIDQVKDIISEVKVSDKDAQRLLDSSNNNLDEISRIYQLAKKQPEIRNFMGWMIKALEDHYDESVVVVAGSEEKAKVVKTIRKSVDENREKFAEEMWERIKEKETFSEFSIYIENSTGFAMAIYEMLIPVQERNKTYGEWFSHR